MIGGVAENTNLIRRQLNMTNETTQHTPGPWKYDELTAKIWDAEDMPVCIPTLNNGMAGRDANARLIAAAPELLEALCETAAKLQSVTHSTDISGCAHALKSAQAAIAAATRKA